MPWLLPRLSALLLGVALIAASRIVPPGPIAAATSDRLDVSVLAYHRFASTVRDSMTVRVSTFRWQLQQLRQRRCQVIRLRQLVGYLQHTLPPPSVPSVVLTVDDGHRSVFTELLPVLQEQGVPITLFIYPSAISNAPYAMTWPQLEAINRSGLVDIESHTYWHPNFRHERRRLAPDAYRAFAATQICRPRAVLRQRLGVDADLIAWPFGIYDDELIGVARGCGYVAGVSLDRRRAGPDADVMALPRFLVTDAAVGASFVAMLPSRDP